MPYHKDQRPVFTMVFSWDPYYGHCASMSWQKEGYVYMFNSTEFAEFKNAHIPYRLLKERCVQ